MNRASFPSNKLTLRILEAILISFTFVAVFNLLNVAKIDILAVFARTRLDCLCLSRVDSL